MMTKMHHYELQATAPLVFGIGKASNFGLGGDSRQFPLPSVTAGAMRAMAEVARGRPPDPEGPDGRGVEVGPPLLLRHETGSTTLMLPRPSDMLAVPGDDGARQLIRLRPGSPDRNVRSDLDSRQGLLRVPVPERSFKSKPEPMGAWWAAELVMQWLAQPATLARGVPEGQLLAALSLDMRTHVGIDDATRASKDGLLFRSAGVDFGGRRSVLCGNDKQRGQHEHFGISVASDDGALHGGHRRVGGEGRLCHVRKSSCKLPERPKRLDRINREEIFRVLLLSPAVFEQHGWMPDWIDPCNLEGVPPWSPSTRVRLHCAALDRSASHSGWVDAAPGKAVRVVPAGTVYWFEALGPIDAEQFWQRSLCAPVWAKSGWGHVIWGRG